MKRQAHPWAKLSVGALVGLVGLVFVQHALQPARRDQPVRKAVASAAAMAPRGEGEPAAEHRADLSPRDASVVGAALTIEESLLAEIRAALGSADDVAANRVLNQLWPALIRLDRAAAFRVLATVPPGQFRLQLLGRLARTWATVDFPGAIDWVAQLTDAGDRAAGFEEACFGAVDPNPIEAIEAWDKFFDQTGGQVRENLVQAWAERDVTAAAAWVKAQSAGWQRDRAAARIAYVLAATKPAEAALVAQQLIDVGPARTEAVLSVLQRWARRDWTAAMNWAAGFTEEDLRNRAIDELAGIPHAGG